MRDIELIDQYYFIFKFGFVLLEVYIINITISLHHVPIEKHNLVIFVALAGPHYCDHSRALDDRKMGLATIWNKLATSETL